MDINDKLLELEKKLTSLCKKENQYYYDELAFKKDGEVIIHEYEKDFEDLRLFLNSIDYDNCYYHKMKDFKILVLAYKTSISVEIIKGVNNSIKLVYNKNQDKDICLTCNLKSQDKLKEFGEVFTKFFKDIDTFKLEILKDVEMNFLSGLESKKRELKINEEVNSSLKEFMLKIGE